VRCMQLLMEKTLQAVRVCLSREVPRKDLTVPTYESLAKLPPIVATILSPVHNRSFWTPMFLLVLKQNISSSVKTLLIDIIILNLFSKVNNSKWLPCLFGVMDAVSMKLGVQKQGRNSGEVRLMGVTLSEMEVEKGPAIASSSQPSDGCDELIDTEPATSTNGVDDNKMSQPSSQPDGLLETRDLATLGSQPQSTLDDRSSQPMSQPGSVWEIRESQPMSNMATMGSQPQTLNTLDLRSSQPGSVWEIRESQPMSNVATMGSQTQTLNTLDLKSSQPWEMRDSQPMRNLDPTSDTETDSPGLTKGKETDKLPTEAELIE